MNRRTLNRNCCFALGILFAMAVPHIAEAQVSLNPQGLAGYAWRSFFCGLGLVEFAFTGCLLTCLMASGHRRRRSLFPRPL